MNQRKVMTDQDLLRAYVDDRDAESFGTLVCRYEGPVLRFTTRLLGDPEAAQDVLQETFLEVLKRPQRLLKVESCHNWLLKVARNLGVDHIRRQARQRKHTAAVAERRHAATAASPTAPDALLERRETVDRVHKEIRGLPPRDREVVLLRIQERKSYREIAEITGLTATNVGFILHKALKRLSRRLRDIRDVEPRDKENESGVSA